MQASLGSYTNPLNLFSRFFSSSNFLRIFFFCPTTTQSALLQLSFHGAKNLENRLFKNEKEGGYKESMEVTLAEIATSRGYREKSGTSWSQVKL